MEKTMFRLRHIDRSGLLAGAAIGLSLLAAGCGNASTGGGAPSAGGAGSSTATDASSVCNLFTDAEISTAAGRAINKHDGVDSTLMGQSICTYEGTDPSTPVEVQIFYTQKAMQLYLSTEASAEHIDGLGDDAFWNPALASLFVRKGDHAMQIVDSNAGILSAADSSTIRDGFKVLAQKAVPKI